MTHKEGNGAVLYLPFAFGCLLREYSLPDDLRLLENMIDWALKDSRVFRMDPCPGLEAVLYQTQNGALLHLINSVGGRPLMKVVPLVDVEFKLLLPPGVSDADVKVLLGPKEVVVQNKERTLTVLVARVEIWSTFEIKWEKMVSITN